MNPLLQLREHGQSVWLDYIRRHLITSDWVFSVATGERLAMHITFEQGVRNKGNPSEIRFYSAKNPSFYQISRQEQVLDILRNVTTNPPDRVKEFSSKGSGSAWPPPS